MRRVCGSFTGAEFRSMYKGKGLVLERQPGDAAWTQVRDAVLELHHDTRSLDPSP